MSATFTLPPILDITSVSSVYQELRDTLTVDTHQSLETSSLERITTPGLQLLIAMKKEFPLVTLSQSSPIIVSICTQAGISVDMLPATSDKGV